MLRAVREGSAPLELENFKYVSWCCKQVQDLKSIPGLLKNLEFFKTAKKACLAFFSVIALLPCLVIDLGYKFYNSFRNSKKETKVEAKDKVRPASDEMRKMFNDDYQRIISESQNRYTDPFNDNFIPGLDSDEAVLQQLPPEAFLAVYGE